VEEICSISGQFTTVDIVAVAVGGDEGVGAVSCWSNRLTLRWFYAVGTRQRQSCQHQPDSAHNIFHRAKADGRIEDLHKPRPIPQQNGELDRVPALKNLPSIRMV
jgi:hypothetical protein